MCTGAGEVGAGEDVLLFVLQVWAAHIGHRPAVHRLRPRSEHPGHSRGGQRQQRPSGQCCHQVGKGVLIVSIQVPGENVQWPSIRQITRFREGKRVCLN